MKIKYSCFLTTFSCVLPYIWERKKSGQIKIKNISAIKEKNVYVKISMRIHVSTQWHIEGMQCLLSMYVSIIGI